MPRRHDFPVTVTPVSGGICHRNNAMISTCCFSYLLCEVADRRSSCFRMPLVFRSLVDSSQTLALHHKSLWCAVSSFGTVPQILTSFPLSVRNTKAGGNFFLQGFVISTIFFYSMVEIVGLTKCF